MNGTVQPVKRHPRHRTVTNHDPRRLKRLRIERGLTIRALAEKAGVGVGSISDLENSRQSARPSMLVALANALDVEIRDLLPPEPQPAGQTAA